MNGQFRMISAEGRRQNHDSAGAVAAAGYLPPATRYLLGLALLASVASAGCSKQIDTAYGQRKGAATYSVNGTAVLGEMFEAEGHKVYSWRWLSPRLQQQADCIVWFPNDFEPPSKNADGENVREWLEDWLLDQPDHVLEDWDFEGSDYTVTDWLEEEPGRTLIYVGRDFDAAAWYWEKVKPGAPPGQAKLIKAAADTAQDDFEIDRVSIPAEEDCQWFTVKGKYQPRKVSKLAGPWAQGVDVSKVEIELSGCVDGVEGAEVLLKSEDDVLVTRRQWGQSQLIVVANGSFLLNLPLVNHQHRKLAGKLIEEVGPPSKTVVFLESDAGGPPIREKDPSAEVPTGMEIFFRPPTCWILWHFAALGVIFCFSRWPIFGLPRRLQRDSTSDFGKHVQALAEMLERSRDEGYSRRRLAHYQQTTKINE